MAECPTSTTCATTRCSPGCTRAWCWSSCCACPGCCCAGCAACRPSSTCESHRLRDLRHPAVDRDHLSRDVRCLLAREEGHERSDLVGAAGPPGRHHACDRV